MEGTELVLGSILEGTELDFGSILEGTELDFGSILKACLGVVWGGFWEGFGRVWRVKGCSFLGLCFLFRVLVAGAFRSVWVENKVP